MVVEALRPELLHPAIVGVSDERGEAVRLRVRAHELEHAGEPRGLRLRHALAVLLQQQV